MTTIEKIRELALGIENEDEFESALNEIDQIRIDFLRRRHAEALAKDTSARDVHTEHCDVRRGCKYGYDRLTDEERVEFDIGDDKRCTVTSGEKIQSYFYDDEEDDD